MACFSALGENVPYFVMRRQFAAGDKGSTLVGAAPGAEHVRYCFLSSNDEAVEACARQIVRVIALATRDQGELDRLCAAYPARAKTWCAQESTRVLAAMASAADS